ncbi:hypothetical protein D3C80_1439370 [compost metagenome]
MKHRGYMNRALRSNDRRFARILGKMGYDMAALATESGVDLTPIPDGWQDLPWPKLRSLASDLTENKIKNKADAAAVIEAELSKRKRFES